MNKKYIIAVNNTKYITRMVDNTFILSKDINSAMVITDFTNAVELFNTINSLNISFAKDKQITLDIIDISQE